MDIGIHHHYHVDFTLYVWEVGNTVIKKIFRIATTKSPLIFLSYNTQFQLYFASNIKYAYERSYDLVSGVGELGNKRLHRRVNKSKFIRWSI